jgi:anti-sigma B factor antagonist/stage II sporulation protein AA (anti-sigma F factor antagonist)
VADRLVGLEIEDRGAVVIARVTGELDIAEAAVTGDRVTEGFPSEARGLVVDFTRLEFIDSSGIAMLFQLVRQLSARRQELHVVAVPGGPVARVLEIVEFGRAAPVHEDVDSAVAAVDSA